MRHLLKRSQVLGILLVLVLITMGLFQNAGGAGWTYSNSFGVPIWIVLNVAPSDRPIPARRILLFIEAKDFTEENLKVVFKGLAAQYEHPSFLKIIAFTEKAMVRQEAAEYLSPTIIEKELEVFKRRREDYKDGYLWADFLRKDDMEVYSYKVDKHNEDYITRSLKE